MPVNAEWLTCMQRLSTVLKTGVMLRHTAVTAPLMLAAAVVGGAGNWIRTIGRIMAPAAATSSSSTQGIIKQ
jgi:hypothetical protein